MAADVSAKTWRRTFRQKYLPKRLRLKTFAETFRMICGAYPVYARSPSPSQRPAPTTIASRSPFPLDLCSCSTSLSKMGIQAAPRDRGVLEEMGTYPRHVLCFPTPAVSHFLRNHGNTVWAFAISLVQSTGCAKIGRRNGIENQS